MNRCMLAYAPLQPFLKAYCGPVWTHKETRAGDTGRLLLIHDATPFHCAVPKPPAASRQQNPGSAASLLCF